MDKRYYCICGKVFKKKYYYDSHVDKYHQDLNIIHIGAGRQNINHDLYEIIYPLTNLFIHNNGLNLIVSINNDHIMKWTKYVIEKLTDHYGVKLYYNDGTEFKYIPFFKMITGKNNCTFGQIRKLFLSETHHIVNNLFICKNIIHCKNKILYTRSDALGRKILNYDKISRLFDIVIHNLNIDVNQQIKLFNDCSHFVSTNGAHMANTIFMHKDSVVVDISELPYPGHNSWQKRYGTHIRNYNFIYANETKLNGNNKSKTRPDGEIDIIIDNKLEKIITDLIIG